MFTRILEQAARDSFFFFFFNRILEQAARDSVAHIVDARGLG